MNVKKTLLLIVLFLIAFWVGAQDRNYSECLVKTSSRWGAPCEKCESYTEGYKRDWTGTYQLDLKNSCRDLIEVKVAVQEKNGTWRTFPVHALAPDESMNAYACQGSGKYIYWARRANDTEIVLPTDREIITEYTSR